MGIRTSLILIALGAAAVGLWLLARGSRLSSGEPNELGQLWSPTEHISLNDVDHSAWDDLLGRYVTAEGLVDYRGLKASDDDTAALRGYLAQLSRVDPQKAASPEATLAFWINAYNAVTVEGIRREYPTSSIKNHVGLVGYNIWDDLLLRVGGKTYSLNAIEHEILRKLGEPRIHFAIVCASIGCPRLLNEAYVAARLDEQLTDNARHFFGQTRNFRVDPSANTVYLSSILSWFDTDFGPTRAAQLERVARYLPDDAAREAAADPGVTVSYLDYDWNLNEQP